MKKVKITADAVMKILRDIFADEEINTVIDDPSAPEEWREKTVQEVLNVEYYTFKRRPVSTDEIIAEKLKSGEAEGLSALGRGFCLVSLGGIERLFSKDVDMAAVSATMEYWLPTSKIKLLEDMIEDCNIAASGERVSVKFGNDARKAVIIFDRPNITDIQTGTACGEMAVCEVDVTMTLYPDVVSYSDYEVEFSYTDDDGNAVVSKLPLSSFSFVNTMTQKAVPYVKDAGKVGSINLSCANSFVLVFDGYNNDFVNRITAGALQAESGENNGSYRMTVTRCGVSYTHEVVIRDHQVTVNADTASETHTLSLVTKGVKYGIA